MTDREEKEKKDDDKGHSQSSPVLTDKKEQEDEPGQWIVFQGNPCYIGPKEPNCEVSKAVAIKFGCSKQEAAWLWLFEHAYRFGDSYKIKPLLYKPAQGPARYREIIEKNKKNKEMLKAFPKTFECLPLDLNVCDL